jgi:hypothetical protein
VYICVYLVEKASVKPYAVLCCVVDIQKVGS